MTVPRGVFEGQNFMTPEVLGHFKGTLSGRTAYVELSTGRGIDDEPIWGVTVRDANGLRFEDPEPSRMFHSLRAATDYITNDLHGRPS
jgi:hypothetical protein